VLQRLRPLLGIEKCALQLIPVSDQAAQDFGQTFLADLAGNAFCVPMMVLLVIGLVTISGRSMDHGLLGSLLAATAQPNDASQPDELFAGPSSPWHSEPEQSPSVVAPHDAADNADNLDKFDSLVDLLMEGLG
jgi:hypothetical protein